MERAIVAKVVDNVIEKHHGIELVNQGIMVEWHMRYSGDVDISPH